jgi:hypothetical protein
MYCRYNCFCNSEYEKRNDGQDNSKYQVYYYWWLNASCCLLVFLIKNTSSNDLLLMLVRALLLAVQAAPAKPLWFFKMARIFQKLGLRIQWEHEKRWCDDRLDILLLLGSSSSCVNLWMILRDWFFRFSYMLVYAAHSTQDTAHSKQQGDGRS